MDDPWTTHLSFAAFDSTASAQGAMSLSGAYDLHITGMSPALEKLNALLPEIRLPALRQLAFTTHLVHGLVPGDLPGIGTTHLHFGSADLGSWVPRLTLAETDVSLPASGTPATVASSRPFTTGQGFKLDGAVGVPPHPDERASLPLDLTITGGARDRTMAVRKAASASRAGWR